MSTSQTDSTWKSAKSESVKTEQQLKAGDKLGHCKVIELIAAGGMANVYKVWHEQLEVIRAIKILKPGFSDESRGRLETEAKISANLHHHNIVEIYGMGYWNSIPYIEMEYVDGLSLKEILERYHRLPYQFAVSVCHAVCVALQFAYNQDMTLYGKVYDGLIHRDIKPANILISSQGKIKLADFGIARPSEVSLHTVGSKVMGTFAYLSPEQLNGEKLDQRSDVYALGAVLYEMISGSKTFPQKLLAELVQKKSKGQFIPLDSIGVQIPRQLCNAVDKSLSLDKSKRFTDAGEFDQELMNILNKITSKPPEDIVCGFMKTPHGSPTQDSVEKQKDRLIPIIIIGILFIVLSSFFYFHRSGIDIKEIKQTNVEKTPAIPISSDTKKPDTITPVQEKSLTSETKKNTMERVEPDLYTKAIKAFESKDYQLAIELFETIQIEKLPSQQRTIRITNLILSYINTGNLEKAAELTGASDIKEPKIFLALSEGYTQQKNFDKALSLLEKAYQNSPAGDFRKKALLLQTRIYDNRYQSKPNRENKRACNKVWSLFIEEFCTGSDDSNECQNAREKFSRYSD